MATPSPDARAALDRYIYSIARLGDGFILDDFRIAQIVRATRTARRVRAYIVFGAVAFLCLLFGALFALVHFDTPKHRYDIVFATIWAISLGGLGAIASIFLHVLKLLPQTSLRTNDEFEVIGRIVLGCLFSAILAITLIVSPIVTFFSSLHELDCSKGATCKIEGSILLLLPFLSGYSITLVLGLLEKAIRAVELTIGIEDRREASGRRRSPRPR